MICPPRTDYLGINTVSIAWMTPLSAATAVSTMSQAFAARDAQQRVAAISNFFTFIFDSDTLSRVRMLSLSASSRRHQHRVDDVDQPVGGRHTGNGGELLLEKKAAVFTSALRACIVD